jgi:aspartyl protease family protein
MKFAPFVLFILALGALVGWFGPGGSGTASVPDAGTEQETAARLEVARDGGWSNGEVVLARAGDGHFYADVAVDGVSARMLVDTGASMVALTGEDADAMGIAWNPQDLEPVARGASGEVFGVRVTVDRMQLGDLEVRSIETVVVPEDLDISLLGQSFLSKVNRVEVAGDEMVLHD